MNYSAIKKNDIANGTGVRVSLFVSGCLHRCKNCFNSVAWDFQSGKPFDDVVQDDIINYLKNDYVEGISLLGGEPLEPQNQLALLPFIKRIKTECPNKTIWCYTGFVYEDELLGFSRAKTNIISELLSYFDVLVDGRFVEEKKNLSLKFRGSTNQRIILMKPTIETGKVVMSKLNEYKEYRAPLGLGV